MNWAAGLRATMMTEEKVRDAASAQTLKSEHEALKTEIEAREESFQAVVEQGRLMVQENHYAAMVRWWFGCQTASARKILSRIQRLAC